MLSAPKWNFVSIVIIVLSLTWTITFFTQISYISIIKMNNYILHTDQLYNQTPLSIYKVKQELTKAPLSSLYRYLAYRKFTRWIHRRLSHHNRKVIPACAVTRIQLSFPSAEGYTGFIYPCWGELWVKYTFLRLAWPSSSTCPWLFSMCKRKHKYIYI